MNTTLTERIKKEDRQKEINEMMNLINEIHFAKITNEQLKQNDNIIVYTADSSHFNN